MKKTIDCFIIGHNEIEFTKYVSDIKKMGANSGAYRDLNLSFLIYNNQPFHAAGMFNLITHNHNEEFPGNPIKPIQYSESFSATIAYLGTYLARKGFTFDYVNSFNSEQEELAEKLEQENILAIAITTTLYVSTLPLLEIMSFIKTHNRSAKIIIGGPFISTQYRISDPSTLDFLFHSIGADFYVNSAQGEATLVKLLHAIKHDLSLDKINNIYYKTGNGYASTHLLKEDNKLSENMVKWDLFSPRVGEYVNLRTTLSCPFSCSFCGFPQHAGKYQTAAVEAVKKELNSLKLIDTVKSVHFIDDTFNVPVKRFKNLLRMMIKNKYKLNWHAQFRCQFADREMVELMKESGCEGVFLGLESGNDQILANMNKTAAVEKYLKGITILKEFEIISYGSFIIGFPGETYKTVEDTIQLIKQSGIDFYRTQLWYCEPITPIWKQKGKYKINGSLFEWHHADMNSKEAADLIDRIFLSINESIWLPQYGFDFNNLFHMTNRGISWPRVKNFIKSFNQGIKGKLAHPSQREMSLESFNRLKDSLLLDDRQFREFYEIMDNKREKQRKKGKNRGKEFIIDFDLD